MTAMLLSRRLASLPAAAIVSKYILRASSGCPLDTPG
jgi:hypothetical protein